MIGDQNTKLIDLRLSLRNHLRGTSALGNLEIDYTIHANARALPSDANLQYYHLNDNFSDAILPLFLIL